MAQLVRKTLGVFKGDCNGGSHAPFLFFHSGQLSSAYFLFSVFFVCDCVLFNHRYFATFFWMEVCVSVYSCSLCHAGFDLRYCIFILQKNVDEAVKTLSDRGIEVFGLVCHVSNAQQRKNLIERTIQV